MDLNLSGKHALVCGSSEGIGRAAAIELASLGADVTLLARREEMAENLRLFYVAVTRAKQRCYLVWGKIREAETAPPAWLPPATSRAWPKPTR